MGAPTKLSKPLVRRLEATDNTRKQRTLFIKIDPEGIITIWPRRCKRASMSALAVYQRGLVLARETERFKITGAIRVVRRGLLGGRNG